MRFEPVAKLAAKAALLTCIGLFVVVPPVHAQEVKSSTIRVMVCPQPDESDFAVDSPTSDSVVDNPQLDISGTLRSVSQINIFIDGDYNNTVAVAGGETTFQSTITVPAGTHTIKLVAADSCNQTTHEASFVVTYIPLAIPGNGDDTDTTVLGVVTPQAGSADKPTTGSAGSGTSPIAAAAQIIWTVPEWIIDAVRESGGAITGNQGNTAVDTVKSTAVLFGVLALAALSPLTDSALVATLQKYYGRKSFIAVGLRTLRSHRGLLSLFALLALVLPFLV